MLFKLVCILATLSTIVHCLPAGELASENTLTEKESSQLSPETEEKATPSLNEMVEIKEEDIEDGAWVMLVEEPIANKEDGESMDTASNVVFRPLFRYRQKQSSRRYDNRRVRRRYYVPRRSYRQTGYYRPRPYRPRPYRPKNSVYHLFT